MIGQVGCDKIVNNERHLLCKLAYELDTMKVDVTRHHETTGKGHGKVYVDRQ